MRKGIVIVGLALLGLGVVVAGVGLLLTTKSVTPLVQGFSGGLSNTTVIGVGESYPIARVHAGEFGVVAYNDSADTPLNVSIPGATSVVYRSAEANGGRLFMAVFVAGANSTVVLTNNQTTAVRVYYGLSEASALGSIAASGLLIVMGGFLFIVGVSYPALKGGASCFKAPPCLLFFNPREGRGGIGRSSTGTADGTHPALLKRTREAFRSRSKVKPQWGQ